MQSPNTYQTSIIIWDALLWRGAKVADLTSRLWPSPVGPLSCARPAFSLAHHAPTFPNHLLKVTCFGHVLKLMNSKSFVVNTILDRCVSSCAERRGVSVHHRRLLSCRLLLLYKQSLLFSPKSLIGARLWNFCFYSYRVVVTEVTRVQRLFWGAMSCQMTPMVQLSAWYLFFVSSTRYRHRLTLLAIVTLSFAWSLIPCDRHSLRAIVKFTKSHGRLKTLNFNKMRCLSNWSLNIMTSIKELFDTKTWDV